MISMYPWYVPSPHQGWSTLPSRLTWRQESSVTSSGNTTCAGTCVTVARLSNHLIQCLTQWLTRTWHWMLRIHEPVSTILITFVKQWRFPHGKPYQDGLSKPFLTTSCIWCTWGLQKTTYLHAWRFWSFGVTTMRKAKVMSNSSKGPALRWRMIAKEKSSLFLYERIQNWIVKTKLDRTLFTWLSQKKIQFRIRHGLPPFFVWI